ncbi:MAG: PIN domain-containing protein [Lautropia sp.]|nr:PIN domain-containing protein [Lautropia sp.]
MSAKALVLDANILIRAVLGARARQLILQYAASTLFFAPDVAYEDARHYLPALLQKRGMDPGSALLVLDALADVVRPLDLELYQHLKADALSRIGTRDEDDWPVLACAMLIDCPVWTEDNDFFGTGVATWTSDRVELFLGA